MEGKNVEDDDGTGFKHCQTVSSSTDSLPDSDDRNYSWRQKGNSARENTGVQKILQITL